MYVSNHSYLYATLQMIHLSDFILALHKQYIDYNFTARLVIKHTTKSQVHGLG